MNEEMMARHETVTGKKLVSLENQIHDLQVDFNAVGGNVSFLSDELVGFVNKTGPAMEKKFGIAMNSHKKQQVKKCQNTKNGLVLKLFF